MVVMYALLRRNPELSHEEFVRHWREVHGPLIAGIPELARHIVRYEQHVRHRPDSASGNDDIDGVAVQWYESIDAFAAFIAEPAYAEFIAPDERRFLDTDRIEFIVTDEPNVVIDGPGETGTGDTGAAG